MPVDFCIRVIVLSRCSLTFLLTVVALSPAMHAQGWDHQRPLAPSVIIDIGAPHAWTMEQAHYLLERNRAHDLGLAEKDPGQLDPNDTIGFRVQALSTLLSSSVQFDQSIGAKNRAAVQSFNAQIQQYNSAVTQRAAVYTQMAQVAASLQSAQQSLSTLQNVTNPDTKAIAQQQAVVDGLNAQNTALNSELTSLNTALATAPTVPSLTGGQPTSDETSATALGDNPLFDNAVKGFNPGVGSSRLSAEQQLDNYINFQYEMVAKQLTLLRDQVGPNSRVLFLELPHSIYVTNKLHLYPYLGGMWGNHLVQSWWTIGGALLSRPLNSQALEKGAHRPATMLESFELFNRFPDFISSGVAAEQNERNETNKLLSQCTAELDKIPEDVKKAHDPDAIANAVTQPCKVYALHPQLLTDQLATLNRDAKAMSDEERVSETIRPYSETALQTFFRHSGDDRSLLAASSDAASNFFDLPVRQKEDKSSETSLRVTADEKNFEAWARYWQYATFGLERGAPGSSTAPIFALDLIPRQSSFNVAAASTSTHQYGFAGVFGWLSGLGARARYERQKQDYSQFTQIENYATAFGKGDYTFGWTFAPNPGTKEIAAGLRTTYAILVVPKDARVVRLNALGCGDRRREVPRSPFAPEAQLVTVDNDSGTSSFKYMTGPSSQGKLDTEDCGILHTFDVEVPSGDDDFWIDNATYNPVLAGQRVTVRISGRFGDQTGVLVNGTPLQRVPSVTQPLLTPAGYAVATNAGDATIQGVFEIVHTRERQDELGSDLVLSFNMAPTFTGTPKILIVSAARDMLVNDVKHRISGTDSRLLDEDPSGPMFYSTPSITRVDTSYPDKSTAVVKIVGRGFTEADDSSLVIGTTPFGPRKNKANPPTPNQEFQVLPGGTVIIATLTRAKFFPQWSIDYISTVGKQVVDTNGTHDDSTGPAIITSCSYTADKAKGGVTPVSVTLLGQFFSGATSPALLADGDGKKITGLTTQLTDNTKWQVEASIPTTTRVLSVTIKSALAIYTAGSNCNLRPSGQQ